MPILGNTEAIAVNQVLPADVACDCYLLPVPHTCADCTCAAASQAWAGHPGRLVQGSGYDGKYVVAQECDATDKTQLGWSFDEASGVIKQNGLCLDNRTGANDANKSQAGANQYSLNSCDGSEYQSFIFNASAADPNTGVLISCDAPVQPSGAKPAAPGACSHGVGKVGPCCVDTNGWWDWVRSLICR